MKTIWTLLAVLMIWGCLGCGDPSRLPPSRTVSLGSCRPLQAMEVAQDVLRDIGFSIEKYDIDQGIIKTRSLSGSQFFEFWRHDNVGGYNTAEANLHSLRRTVLVTIDSGDGDSGLSVRCDAQVQRMSLPQRDIAGMSQAPSLFTGGSRYQQRLQINPEQEAGIAWIDLGADPALENEILRQIQFRISRLEGKP